MKAKTMKAGMKIYYPACLIILCIAYGCNKTTQPPAEGREPGAPNETGPHSLMDIYTIVNQTEVESTSITRRPVKEIIGDRLEDVEIIHSDWPDSDATRVEILELFQNTQQVADNFPIWNVTWGVEVVGILKYRNGREGKFAIAGFKVGFQDETAQPWYFEWAEKFPSRNMR